VTGSVALERKPVEARGAPRISLVIPVNHPSTDVRMLVREYSAALDRLPYGYEFVFVVDGIGGALLKRLEEMQPFSPIKIVTLQGGGFGESIAITAGVEKASGEFIITAPQYLQIEPREVEKLIAELEAGHDLVTPWRKPRVDPWFNQLQSTLFNWVLRLLCRMKFHDMNCNFRGMRRHVLEEITIYGDLYRFLPIMAHRQGFRVKEVQVAHREEVGKRGFFGVGVYLRRLLDILAVTFLTRFTQKPLRFFGTVGLALILVGLALVVRPVYGKLFLPDESILKSTLFLVGVVLNCLGVQFVGFGLVGEIIIFTQAPHVREYKIDRFYDAVATPVTAPLRPHHVVRPLGPGEDGWWDDYVRGHPGSNFFHLNAWRRVVERVFGHKAHYLLAEEGGRIRGVLPVFFVKSLFLGRTMISVPYGVYGGVIADDRDAELALLRDAIARAERERVRYLELRQTEDHKLGLATSSLYVTYVKDLPDDPAKCLEFLPRKARAEARRGRDRSGLVFAEGCDPAVFFSLFTGNKHGLGSPALPRRMFDVIREELEADVVTHSVKLPGGATAAGVMSFKFRDTLMAYYSGADDQHEGLGLNNFMYWKLMEWAVERGFRKFDFGRSRVATGSATFKKNMGFEPTPLHYGYHLVGDGRLPGFHPGNPRLELPRKLWRLLPMFVANPMGGWLSRYLP
jgi:FemAB-related protein (PEP-CTERM system-associated)